MIADRKINFEDRLELKIYPDEQTYGTKDRMI